MTKHEQYATWMAFGQINDCIQEIELMNPLQKYRHNQNETKENKTLCVVRVCMHGIMSFHISDFIRPNIVYS